MLCANELQFEYSEKPLFSGVSFSLALGECLQIKGKNGVGKTTLLKLVVGLMQPQGGTLIFETDELRHLVYVGHQPGLSHALTLEENLTLDWQFGRGVVDINALLAVFNLQALRTKSVATLSEGQRRQVALLRLWMTDAVLWVLDEPFTALDTEARQTLQAHLNAHLAKGGMIVMTSHQPVALSSMQSLELG